MKTQISLRALVQNTLFRIMGVWMIAVLLAGAAVAAQSVGQVLAEGCTNTGDGSWSNSAIWSCITPGHVPGIGDDVTISNTTAGVTITSAQSVHNLTINLFGTLVFGSPVTLTISGNFDVAATGMFDPGSGPRWYWWHGDIRHRQPDDHDEWYYAGFLELAKIASGLVKPYRSLLLLRASGEIHILNTLTLKGTSPNYLLLRSTSTGTQWQINPVRGA